MSTLDIVMMLLIVGVIAGVVVTNQMRFERKLRDAKKHH